VSDQATANIDILGPVRVAQANTLATVTAQVDQMNRVAKDGYLTQTWPNFAQSIVDGRPAPGDPPKPPMAWEVGFFKDPTSGPGMLSPFGSTPVEWAYPKVGSTPVCPMPPIPIPTTHTIEAGKIGTEDPTDPGWFSVLAGDTTPGGKKVVGVSADGKTGLFLKWASPFGSVTTAQSGKAVAEVGGWYQKIG
jgi:hypothetical protein